jgi:hypothetical protein
VRPSRPALVACPAGNGRFDDDGVARPDSGDAPADLLDDARALVPGDEGVGHPVFADGTGEEVVEIAAANADGSASDEDVVVPDDTRRRDLADLDRPDAGQEGGFHGHPIIMQKDPVPEDSGL